MKGFVYLVGARPGDPGLLTLAGAEALRRATAVVHDALVSRAILDLANPAAQFYDVGKRLGTLPEQVQVFGTLGDIAERVHTAGLGSPMVTIIGNVVALRAQLGYLNG